ncbi:PH domain-containing protein [Klenkia sp. PcliD-1-E]|uniref:PH domain-containing protein n=1 Tax=Klenkia sp. PcliD-1-E TaxID=2954492 RepID=UPI002097DAF6|nr:PH domain-containing protein [Klenkia sp. PcliD-1-E]MCO7219093.1 PH domain-containing protein [Klenkia sp. PcliD-1-E]
MSRVALVPVVVLLICTLPVATAAWWGVPVLLVPALVTAWVLRVGLDIGPDGITPRSLLAGRTVPWSEVAGIRVDDDRSLWLVRTTGTEVRLPVVRARDLPRLASVSGGRIPDPEAAPPAQ